MRMKDKNLYSTQVGGRTQWEIVGKAQWDENFSFLEGNLQKYTHKKLFLNSELIFFTAKGLYFKNKIGHALIF